MNLERIAGRHPSERKALSRLAAVLEKEAKPGAEYTLSELCDATGARDSTDFALALGDLVRSGDLRQVIRVISPSTQGGIGDFDRLDDIPEEIHDWRTDTKVEVTPENLRVVYVVPAHDDAKAV